MLADDVPARHSPLRRRAQEARSGATWPDHRRRAPVDMMSVKMITVAAGRVNGRGKYGRGTEGMSEDSLASDNDSGVRGFRLSV